MKIKLTKGRHASEKIVSEIETRLGCNVSYSFKLFIKEHNGAVPESNIFKINDHNESDVNQFIPAEKIINECTYIENLPEKSYPIAWDSCGNYVFIDESKNGAVFYWDHELPDEITEIAGSFSEFLDILETFD